MLLIAFVLFFAQCRPPRTTESMCAGSAKDGSFTVEAFGYSYFQRLAINNAKKNAVSDVLFKGIKAGTSGCTTRPIIDDPSKKNNDFFKDFFKKGGTYLQFVNVSGDNVPSRSKVGLRTKAGVYVIVDHRRLQQYMVEKKQAKSLTNGF